MTHQRLLPTTSSPPSVHRTPARAAGVNSTRLPVWSHQAPLQPKLAINQPGDAYEQEADRVADQVTTSRSGAEWMHTLDSRAAAPSVESTAPTGLATDDGGTVTTAPPIVHQALQSPGRPLDASTRRALEPRFGQDFDAVRVHDDAQAAASASAVHARAYTVGSDIVFGQGQHAPHTARGQRLLAHELTHVIQQRGGAPGPDAAVVRRSATGILQRDIAEDRLPRTPVEQIMADPNYLENGIQRIEFFSAELAILHYADGSQIRLGLVPEYIEAPFEAVDYRTLRSSHIPITSTATSLGQGSIRFLPRGREAEFPPGTTFGDVQRIAAQVGRTIRFTHHPSGRIVPTEVNSISAPRLCQVLRETEAEYVRRFDAMARGAVEILRKLEWIVILGSMVGGVGGAGSRAATGRAAAGRAGAAAATGVVGRAQSTLLRFFSRLLRTGATEAITVEGVGFGGVRVALRGTELAVTRGAIINVSRAAGQGRLIHAAFEQAAIQAARQAGARTARVALELVQNPRWAAYLESQGYSFQVLANEAGGFTRVLTRVFTL